MTRPCRCRKRPRRWCIWHWLQRPQRRVVGLRLLLVTLAAATLASCALVRPVRRCHTEWIPFYSCRADGTLETGRMTITVCR